METYRQASSRTVNEKAPLVETKWGLEEVGEL